MQNNTEIYRKVFGCYPDDEIKCLDQIKLFKKSVNKEEYDREIAKIQGHVVCFPLRFLEN
jgi:phospholipase D1/2